MVEITTGKYPAAYALSNGWCLSQTCGGYALLAPGLTGSVRLCGVIRHHIKSFVEAFEGEPLEKSEFTIDRNFDETTAELDETFRQLPLCYGFSRGWKLLKAEQHFKLAPTHSLFALPAAIITGCIAQFAQDMGGEPLVEDEPERRIRIAGKYSTRRQILVWSAHCA